MRFSDYFAYDIDYPDLPSHLHTHDCYVRRSASGHWHVVSPKAINCHLCQGWFDTHFNGILFFNNKKGNWCSPIFTHIQNPSQSVCFEPSIICIMYFDEDNQSDVIFADNRQYMRQYLQEIAISYPSQAVFYVFCSALVAKRKHESLIAMHTQLISNYNPNLLGMKDLDERDDYNEFWANYDAFVRDPCLKQYMLAYRENIDSWMPIHNIIV